MSELQNPEIFRTVLDSLQIGVYLVDRERRIVYWNEGAEHITGYLRHDVVGRFCRENVLMHCNDKGCVLCGTACPLTDALQEGKPKEAQVYLRHKAGHRVPVQVRVVPIRDRHGSVIGAAETFEEDLAISGADVHQSDLAAHGCLAVTTGVPNHAFTQSHLRENLDFSHEYNLPFGILRIQVDQLEHLKARHGREAVGTILHVVAQTMKHTLRPDGFLGRWAEDQFLAIVTYCGSAELEKAADKVQQMVSCSGIQWWDDFLSIMISVGRAMVQPGDTMESVLERAALSPGAGAGRDGAAASPERNRGAES